MLSCEFCHKKDHGLKLHMVYLLATSKTVHVLCWSINILLVGRNRYQLEIPESVVSRHAPEEYDLKSQKKGYRRYWTPTIERLLQQLVDKETQRDDALKDTMRTIFHSFDEQYVMVMCVSSTSFSSCSFTLWEAAVNCVCTLDVLCSMAVFRCVLVVRCVCYWYPQLLFGW